MTTVPLAHRLRPQSLDDFIGQEAILGHGTPLRTLIERDCVRSLFLSGPPGTGKTTIASIIAATTKARFIQINAVMSGIKELREVCLEAERRHATSAERTVLFIDEIHRFTASQQDALLPYVERGSILLIGATTEHLSFSVQSALLSRSHVFECASHTVDSLTRIIERALRHPDGYAGSVHMHPDAIRHIAERSDGDARIALNLLELSVLMIGADISFAEAEKVLLERRRRYDAKGSRHYDMVSAFIKSIRGSDGDAALLWMFAMLECGEEPRFLLRRMAILASEDIGNADPHAFALVVAAWQSYEMIGMPEAEYMLSQACLYLAQAPKSNAVTTAMKRVKIALKASSSLEVPQFLRQTPMANTAKGAASPPVYQYPFDAPDAIVAADYFPVGWSQERDFYRP